MSSTFYLPFIINPIYSFDIKEKHLTQTFELGV